jgi:hypothetical protein
MLMPTDIDRLRDDDLERVVLGQMLAYRDAQLAYLRGTGLEGQDIANPISRLIFEAISAADADGLVTDPVTVATRLREMGRLDEVGPGFVLKIAGETPRPAEANIRANADRLRMLARARRYVHDERALTVQLLADPQIITNGLIGYRRQQLDALEADTPNATAGLLDDVAILDTADLPMLVADRLPADALGLLISPPGTGKSLVGLDLGLSVATGRDWLGACVARSGPVFWVLSEGGVSRFARRLRAAKLARGHQLTERVGLYIWPEAVSLLDARAIARLSTAVRAIQPALTVLDTYSRCTAGADENSAKDTSAIVAVLDQIRSISGGLVLALHHLPKDGRLEPRGSTALAGAVDTILTLQRVGSDRLRLACAKQRDGAPFAPVLLRLQAAGDSVVPVFSEPDVPPPIDDSLDAAITGTLAQHPFSGSRLAGTLHQDRSLVFARLRRLEAAGRVAQEGQGRSTRWRLLDAGISNR